MNTKAPTETSRAARRIVVVGSGMVGHRFVEACADRGVLVDRELVVIGEEPQLAYDRVALSSYFDGASAHDLALATDEAYAELGVVACTGTRVSSIDTAAREVVLADGRRLAYADLVLATGSYPFVPPISGVEAAGVFVYRTLDDLDRIRAFARAAKSGIVVGGGLLGLEAANALRLLGLQAHVVEFAPRLMAVQLDGGGAAMLQRHVANLGVHVHVDHAARAVLRDERGQVRGLEFGDGSELAADMVVFAAGIRPRDELGRESGLAMGERGGVAIDDHCRTSDAHVWAVGECASHRDRVYGLVAPGYRMAEAVADNLVGLSTTFEAIPAMTKLKLLGVEVASCGDNTAVTPDSVEVVLTDELAGTYKKLVVSTDGSSLRGAVLVGDSSAYPTIVSVMMGDLPMPSDPSTLIASGPAVLPNASDLGATATICSCHNVTKARIVESIRSESIDDLAGVKRCTKAATGCGSCSSLVETLLKHELIAAGKTVTHGLCEHFAHTRSELFDIVRVRQLSSFGELIAAHGQGAGCEICKPVVASILASLANGYILDGEQAGLQDTNDFALANMQRDGSYSVIPRIPGGEITPDALIAIGEVARDFDLYTKITGGQRIDLLGARLEQLPDIWRRLIDAGFESGHAYGKALRTVKSCVGETWCRYGMQDSVRLAIDLELRYRGLRAPHKLKSAVSGCARECAEARSKDFGIIATERGYNLYVGGNGGMRPRHAELFAEDLDRDTLVRYLDRYLMYYIRTAERLERTSVWVERFEGGIEGLRRVIVDDALGIVADLEADMARHVATYECEWKATLERPERLALFRPFINVSAVDSSVVFVRERNQKRPARPDELEAALR